MDHRRDDNMRAVLRIEVLQIRNVLEIVCVHFTALHNIVRLNIIGKLLDIQRDIFFCKDLLRNLQNLCMRCRGCGDCDRRARQRLIIDICRKAVPRLFHDTDDCTAVSLSNIVRCFLTFQCRRQRFYNVRILVSFLHG